MSRLASHREKYDDCTTIPGLLPHLVNTDWFSYKDPDRCCLSFTPKEPHRSV